MEEDPDFDLIPWEDGLKLTNKRNPRLTLECCNTSGSPYSIVATVQFFYDDKRIVPDTRVYNALLDGNLFSMLAFTSYDWQQS